MGGTYAGLERSDSAVGYAQQMGWRTLFTTVLLVAVIAVPAQAQTVVTPGDFCFESDHSGDNEFGSPSIARLILTLSPEFAGTWLDVAISGASGDLFRAAEIGSDGVVILEIPLTSFGPHQIIDGTIDSAGVDLPLDVTGLSFEIDAAEPVCNISEMAKVALGITTTTAAPTTTTTAVAVAPAPSTTSSSTTSTTAPESSPETPGGGGWILPFGLGMILLIGGIFLWKKPDDPCQEELAAWQTAQAACDQARAASETAREKCDEAEGAVSDLEQQQKDICKEWPPACWETEDGGWIEEAGKPGTRITQRDLHMRSEALGDVWDAYQRGDIDAEQVQDAWERADTSEFREQMRQRDAQAAAQLGDIGGKLEDAEAKAKTACDEATTATKEAEEACTKASAAKKAYFDCMDAAAPDPAPEPGSDPSGPATPGPTGGGGTPPTAPPPDPPPSAPPEEEREEVVCCADAMWIGYGWTTGGMLFVAGYESSILQFICVSCGDRYVEMSSRSFRFGVGLGGETALFGALMWDVPHAHDVPRVWREKAASGFDFDLSFGPSVSKGLKNVLKGAGAKKAGEYLRWAARNEVPSSALDPRKLETLKTVGKDIRDNIPTGVGRGLQSQGAHPQVLVLPLGAGLQVGAWLKAVATSEVTDFRSCGCPWPP